MFIIFNDRCEVWFGVKDFYFLGFFKIYENVNIVFFVKSLGCIMKKDIDNYDLLDIN